MRKLHVLPESIVSQRLTSCTVEEGGDVISLGLIEDGGETVLLRLPARQAEAISMTLPHLLTEALRVKSKNDHARYVYQLDQWTLGKSEDDDVLIITLSTPDGFQTSFAIPPEFAKGLSYALREIVKSTKNAKSAPKPSIDHLN